MFQNKPTQIKEKPKVDPGCEIEIRKTRTGKKIVVKGKCDPEYLKMVREPTEASD